MTLRRTLARRPAGGRGRLGLSKVATWPTESVMVTATKPTGRDRSTSRSRCSRPDSSEAALAVFWILLIVLIVSALFGGVGYNRR